MRLIDRLLNLLLGARCHVCGTRVFTRDAVDHYTSTSCVGGLR